jgi:hypothetical protein
VNIFLTAKWPYVKIATVKWFYVEMAMAIYLCSAKILRKMIWQKKKKNIILIVKVKIIVLFINLIFLIYKTINYYKM